MPNINLFVTTDVALDSGTAGYTDPSLVADGALAVLNAEDSSAGSLNLGGTSLSNKALIVLGGDFPQIELIEKSKIKEVRTQAYRAEVKQKTAVGYDGTSGSLSIDAGIGTIKVVRLERGHEPFPRFTANAKITTSSIPYNVAKDLVAQFGKANGERKFVTADIISSEVSTQLEDTDSASVTLAVTNGLRSVTATVTSTKSIATLTAGDQIRIGHATDTSYPVYVVSDIANASGTSQVITLDRPYVGTSATGVAAGIVTAGPPADNDEIGIVLTAVSSVDGEPAISFSTSVDDVFENDQVSSLVTPQTANGSNAQILNLEKASWGNRSYTQTNYFPQTPASRVASGENYDLLTIVYENNGQDAVVSSNKYREIHIAYPAGKISLSTLAAFFNS